MIIIQTLILANSTIKTTLTVAINIQDYIFLASDQRLTIECAPETNLPPKTYISHYKKIKYWEYGAITVSGDVMLNALFLSYFTSVCQAKLLGFFANGTRG